MVVNIHHHKPPNAFTTYGEPSANTIGYRVRENDSFPNPGKGLEFKAFRHREPATDIPLAPAPEIFNINFHCPPPNKKCRLPGRLLSPWEGLLHYGAPAGKTAFRI